jgi:hypothetical protein
MCIFFGFTFMNSSCYFYTYQHTFTVMLQVVENWASWKLHATKSERDGALPLRSDATNCASTCKALWIIAIWGARGQIYRREVTCCEHQNIPPYIRENKTHVINSTLLSTDLRITWDHACALHIFMMDVRFSSHCILCIAKFRCNTNN